MEKLEKYSLEAVQNTLLKCSGIKICIISENVVSGHVLMQQMIRSCRNDISVHFSDMLIFKNGSDASFISQSRQMGLCGKRYNQVFLNGDYSEEFLQTVALPLVTHYPTHRGAIFRYGVFQLFDELDFVKRLSASIIHELQNANSVKELKDALNKGLAAIDNEYAN